MTTNELMECYKRTKGTTDHVFIYSNDLAGTLLFSGTPAQFLRSCRRKRSDTEVVSFYILPRFKANFEIVPLDSDQPKIRNINTGVEIYVYVRRIQ